MNHSTILKKIHTTFINDWIDSKVRLDSSEEIKDKIPYISLSYLPQSTKQRFLTAGDAGLNFKGNLRITIYEKNPTKNLELLDKVVLFLRNKSINGLKYTEQEGLGAPFRSTPGDLYESFVDFEACLIH